MKAELKTPHSELMKARHDFIRLTRDFFYSHGYLEVETPNLTKTAAPDPNIEPLKVYVSDKGPFFLHTSPEMRMKKLLLHGHERIFQICKVYRAEESEEIHNTEFTMFEWYREGTYHDAMNEVEDLITFVVDHFPAADKSRFARPWQVYDLAELFIKETDINPFKFDREAMFLGMQGKGFIGIDHKDTYFIKDWPLSVSTMAKRKDAHRVERFELYINGLEIANGYTELLDRSEQRQRFVKDNSERKASGKQTFVIDEEFLDVLGKLQGPYAGVSIGVDRLLMVLLGKDRIADVLIERLTI